MNSSFISNLTPTGEIERTWCLKKTIISEDNPMHYRELPAFCDKENLSKQEWFSLVQLTHRVDITTPNVLHQK